MITENTTNTANTTNTTNTPNDVTILTTITSAGTNSNLNPYITPNPNQTLNTLYVDTNSSGYIINEMFNSLKDEIDRLNEEIRTISDQLCIIELDKTLAERYPELKKAFDEYKKIREQCILTDTIKQSSDTDTDTTAK